MKHSKVVIFAVALALLAGPAMAQQAGGPQPGAVLLKCLSILGLTDSQKADIKAILDAEKVVLQGLGQTLKTDAAALKAAVEANPPNACAIGTALLKVRADEQAIKTELQKMKTNVEAVLTAEQKAKFEGCLQGHAPPHSNAQVDEGELSLD